MALEELNASFSRAAGILSIQWSGGAGTQYQKQILPDIDASLVAIKVTMAAGSHKVLLRTE